MSESSCEFPLFEAQRLVVVCPSWVGDTVMATPVLRAIRSHRPGTHVIVLCRPGLDELLTGLDSIDEVVTHPMRGWRGAGMIRGCRADAALLLPNSFRSALMVRLGGVPTRIGYARDGRSWLLTHRMSPGPRPRRGMPIPTIEYYARLGAWALGVPSIGRKMELGITAAQREARERVLRGVSRPFMLLNPGANRTDKRWSIERFAAAADALAKSHGLAVAACGSPAEGPLLDQLTACASTPIVNLARRGLTLGSLKAVIQQCSMLITNDTGPRHIAAAFNRPTVALFGPTDHRWTTLPGATERVLMADPFLPEDQVADQHPRQSAMEKIPVSDVVAAAHGLLDEASVGRP